jgi:hypothetical protein
VKFLSKIAAPKGSGGAMGQFANKTSFNKAGSLADTKFLHATSQSKASAAFKASSMPVKNVSAMPQMIKRGFETKSTIPQSDIAESSVLKEHTKNLLNPNPGKAKQVQDAFKKGTTADLGELQAGDITYAAHNPKVTDRPGEWSSNDDLTAMSQAERIDKMAIGKWNEHPATDMAEAKPYIQLYNEPAVSGTVAPQSPERPDKLPITGGGHQNFLPQRWRQQGSRLPLVHGTSPEAQQMALESHFTYGGGAGNYHIKAI